MEILLDTANLDLIRHYHDVLDIAGVTTNPTILARENADFWETLVAIRGLIGEERQLHVQLTGRNAEEMIREAETVRDRLGGTLYFKIPANELGLRAIKHVKSAGFNVTATTIYTPQQALLAASVGADYLAPYFNRIEDNDIDAPAAIREIVNTLAASGVKAKVLAASFKNTRQVVNALLAGAQAITVAPLLYTAMVETPLIQAAIDIFDRDWHRLYGDKRIYEL